MKRTVIFLILIFSSAWLSAEVYVSTDKRCYIAGEAIGCSLFCNDANAVAYLELVSTEGSVSRAKAALVSGRGAAALRIPIDTPTGNYRLIAYTASDKGDWFKGSPVLSVFNTFSPLRVKEGVEIVEDYVLSRPQAAVSGGLGLETGSVLRLTNTSGKPVSVALSVTVDDGIAAPSEWHSISGFNPAASPAPAPEYGGEIIHGRIVGEDAAKVSGDGMAVAVISVPGQKTDIYNSMVSPDGTVSFETSNIYGGTDIVCMVQNQSADKSFHLELDSPFVSPTTASVPVLRMGRGIGKALEERASILIGQSRKTDTILTTLPLRRDHFFLTHECTEYILDDYTRFPTMQEVFVEILRNVRARSDRNGKYVISVLMDDRINDPAPYWGRSLMLLDGVPVFDHNKIMSYDPSGLKAVEIYPYTYNLGDCYYEGVMNYVTFEGKLSAMSFEDNVRIYDFVGVDYPADFSGGHTLHWRPLVSLLPGESIELDCSAGRKGARYSATAEGLDADGGAVFARASFVL